MRAIEIDGVYYECLTRGAKKAGINPDYLATHAWKRKKNGVSVFEYEGHTINTKPAARPVQKPAPLPVPAPALLPEPEPLAAPLPVPAPVIQAEKPEHVLAQELKNVKEEIRYLRECLIGRLHGLDEISEHLRQIEKRLIDEKHVRGSYNGGMITHSGIGAERLG